MGIKVEKEKIIRLLKLLFLVILIFISLSIYLFLIQKRIVRKDVFTDFTKSLVQNKPQKLENYLIGYRGKEFTLANYIFSDANMANSFFDEFLLHTKEIFTNQNHIEINGYGGFKVEISKPEEGVGIIIKKDNFVIIASGKNGNNLENVVKWFINTKNKI